MSVINTNITSMIGQQNLRESQNNLQTSMERLSSGLRINSAKDDAAGQAIANRMSSQITGLGQAQRNANDGISISQTAEGGLNQINDNLQRVRELTVQAQNGTNSTADLQSIQDEIGQRLNEINRISEETDFNGTKVLADGVEKMNIQVGANDGESISVNLETVNTKALGISDFSVGGFEQKDNALAADADMLSAGFVASGDNYIAGQADADDVVGLIAEEGDVARSGDVTYTRAGSDAITRVESELAAGATSGGVLDDSTAGGAIAAGTYSITNDEGVTVNIDVAADGTITSGSGTFGITAGGTFTISSGSAPNTTLGNITTVFANSTASEDLTLTGTGGTAAAENISVTGNLAGDTFQLTQTINDSTASGEFNGSTMSIEGTDYTVAAGGATVTADGSTQYVTTSNQLSDTQTTLYGVKDADGNDTFNTREDGTGQTIYVDGDPDATSTLTTDATYTNEDVEASRTADPLDTLDSALNQVDSLRSELGAVQNRFESAITNLSTNETNLSAARSRIEDADYAVEVANMTRAQILQQAGTSVLSQANQIPQNVLSLLG
ncbi:flagellin [Halomonas sp. 1390]|uniref:flagellin N-terminal helical domain-containing protein n=1 Tax=Halomonas sp. B23F22_3 TaxID=3459516 RepID=UPI00373E8AB2